MLDSLLSGQLRIFAVLFESISRVASRRILGSERSGGLRTRSFPFFLGEEFGWRGFLLPRLMARRSPAVATLIMGLNWTA